MSEKPSEPEDDEQELRQHLEGVEDGCGCTEIWEHLSENRGSDA